jgi:exonuclease SbcD
LTFTFLQVADLHLAWPFTGLPERVSRLRRAELRAALVRLVDLALAERVSLVLIAGDLYEHTHADRPLAAFIAEQLARLAPIPVLVSPGNHDPLLPGSYWETYPWPPNVRVFDPTPERFDLDELNLTVWGWGFGAWEVHDFQLGGIRRAPGRVNLGLFHGGGAPYHPFGAAELQALDLDYVALGHIHKPGPITGRDGRLLAWYSGSPEPLSFGEPGEHGAILGRVEEANGRGVVTCRFLPLASRSCLTRAVDLTGVGGPEAAAARIGAAFTDDERQRDLCRVQLTGRIDPALSLETAMLEEMLAPTFLHLRVEDKTEPDWDLEAIAREKSVRGLFVERLQRLAAGADSHEVARIRRALHLGLTALAKGEG